MMSGLGKIAITYEGASDQPSLSEQYPDLEPRMVESQYGEIMYNEDGSDRELEAGHPSPAFMFSYFTGLCDVRKLYPTITGQAEDWARLINIVNRDKKDRVQIKAAMVNTILLKADIRDRDWVLKLNITRLPARGAKPSWFMVARRLGAKPLPGIAWVDVPALPQPQETGDATHDRAAMDAWRQRELVNQMRGLPQKAREAIERDNALGEITAEAHVIKMERLVESQDKVKSLELTVKETLALMTGAKNS
jgi:hypothetical protein